jgi:tetratricopeptide (TPR) repeat protein
LVVILAAYIGVVMSGVSIAAAASDTVLAAPTFNGDIAPLLYQHCAACHRPGGSAPFPLITYRDARAKARQIARTVATRAMPPWKPDAPPGVFEGDRRLTDAQIDVFRRWVEGGAVLGDPRHATPPPVWSDDWQLGKPDLVLHLAAPYRLPAGGSDRLRNFVLPVPVSTTRYVRAWEFRTTNLRVVHHATMMVDKSGLARQLDANDPDGGYEGLIPVSARTPEGYFLGWTPGQTPHESSREMTWRLDPGNDLIVMLHLRPSDVTEVVDASVALYFSDHAPSRLPVMIRLNRQDLDIPAGTKSYVARDTYTLPVDVRVYEIQPHAHYLARDIKGYAQLPDGTTRTLIHIADWDFHWQDVFQFRDPIRLPAGTILSMEVTYDNSANNRSNPSFPPKRVIFGQRTSDEMGDLWLQVVPEREADHVRLVSDLRRKLVPQDIDGYRKMIEAEPGNASLHDDLALLAFEEGDRALAVEEFREASHLQPADPSRRYNLGNALLAAGRSREAVQSFREALTLRPAYGLARQGLGLALAANGDLDAAISELQTATNLLPQSAEPRYNLGILYRNQGRSDEALTALDDAMRLDPASADAPYAAGLIREAREDYAGARTNFRHALEADAGWGAALSELAWTLAVDPNHSSADVNEAVRRATDAVMLTGSKNWRALDSLAAALAAAGRYEEAAARERNALDLLPLDTGKDVRAGISERINLFTTHHAFIGPTPPGR